MCGAVSIRGENGMTDKIMTLYELTRARDDYWEKYSWDNNPEANASFSSVSALLRAPIPFGGARES
jgi:hypothetical protein